MRVFFDTNVLASAFASDTSFTASVFRCVTARFDFVTSDYVLKEFIRILPGKFNATPEDVLLALDVINMHEVVRDVDSTLDAPINDNDDKIILRTAASVKINIFLTGDAELLKLKIFNGVRIMKPRDFFDAFCHSF